MPQAPEPLAQLAEVVDLAVLDDADRAVLVGDRLVSGRGVDDGQPPHAERDAVGDVTAFFVGAAMTQ